MAIKKSFLVLIIFLCLKTSVFSEDKDKCKELICNDKTGFDLTYCIFNNGIIQSADRVMQKYPKATVIFFLIISSLFMFLRKVDTTLIFSYLVSSKKIVDGQTAYMLIMTFWDRDVCCVVYEVIERINIDNIETQSTAKDYFENILYKYRNKTIEMLSEMVDKKLLDKVSLELNEIYDVWLTSLVNLWSKNTTEDSWLMDRHFRQAMNDKFERYKDDVKRKIIKNNKL